MRRKFDAASSGSARTKRSAKATPKHVLLKLKGDKRNAYLVRCPLVLALDRSYHPPPAMMHHLHERAPHFAPRSQIMLLPQ